VRRPSSRFPALVRTRRPADQPDRRRGLVVAIAVVALAALLGGCGGKGGTSTSGTTTAASSRPVGPAAVKRAYVAKMRVLGEQLGQQLATIGSAAGASPQADARTLKTAIPKLRAAARKLQSITPPKAVKAQHERLIRGVLEFAQELNGPITQLEGGDLNGLSSILSLPGIRKMEAASKSIVLMGYAIVATK